jgi:probable F420-dependent oxidoreductase
MATFSLHVVPETAAEWLDTARRAEAAGFDTLLTADHPGACAAPFVALAAAAAVTARIKLGSYVSNAGVREPMLLAADVATLDVVSGGRAVLGLGAGHTPAEWAAVGRTRPDVRGRVDRCIAVAEATMRLLAGEEVDVDIPQLRMAGAKLDEPRPVQERVPLIIGGGNARLLRWAGEHADLIGLSGLGRTLDDGHSHTVRWRPDEIDAQVAAAAGKPLEALVQHVEVTDDAEAALAEMAERTGLSADELRQVPYVLAGTEDEIVASIREHERRWGITRYAVRRPALEALAGVMKRTA